MNLLFYGDVTNRFRIIPRSLDVRHCVPPDCPLVARPIGSSLVSNCAPDT